MGRRGKKVMGTSRVVGRQMDNELAALRADLRANREGRENAPPAPATPAIAKAKARYAAAARRAPATPVQPRGFSEPELHALKTIFAMFDQDGGERLSRAWGLSGLRRRDRRVRVAAGRRRRLHVPGGQRDDDRSGRVGLVCCETQDGAGLQPTPATPVSPVASRTTQRGPRESARRGVLGPRSMLTFVRENPRAVRSAREASPARSAAGDACRATESGGKRVGSAITSAPSPARSDELYAAQDRSMYSSALLEVIPLAAVGRELAQRLGLLRVGPAVDRAAQLRRLSI